MIKLILIIIYLFLSNCSFTKTGFWTEDKKIEELRKNSSKIFEKKVVIIKEFNSNTLIKLDNTNVSNKKPNYITNNLGIEIINEDLNKSSKFRFSKIDNFGYFEPELNFDDKTFFFFDNKGNLIKFDENFKILWKKNYYSKSEKKLKPILSFANDKNLLVIFDNISKFYAVNINSGDLVWSKQNTHPFNSQIKIFDNKIYSVDMNNVLRCFSLKDGSEIWSFKSENTFLKSKKRNSLLIANNLVYFNNSLGDITAVDAYNGKLIWQTPTQGGEIYENAFSLITSDLVIKNDEIIFSNNRNEFFSINSKNGLVNWKQEINSEVRPVYYNNLIFTVSNEGYFFVIDSKLGNILRITDIFNIFENKKRKKVKPVGFVINSEKIFLSTNNGRLLIVDIRSGKIEKTLKIDNEKISRPFVFDKKILLVKNNSIIRLN